MTINFYSHHGEYGEFSNFSAHSVEYNGKNYPTSEHAFQAMKFLDKSVQEQVRKTKRPHDAAKMGRDRSLPLRKDWESVKDGIMKEILVCKFTQHEELKQLLLSTGTEKLVEHTSNDSYWGDGGDGTGKNMLGRLLMEVRSQLV